MSTVILYMSMSVDGFIAAPGDEVGRRTFELAGQWGGEHHDGAPIFVLTRTPPEQPASGHARYVTDPEEAVADARRAAGERDVMVHGASAAQALFHAGLIDEIVIHLVPLLLGRGRRLFDDPAAQTRGLRLISSREGAGALHLRYRVLD